MKRAYTLAGSILLAGILGAAAFCCGPKTPAPELVPTCPGDKFEVCEPGDGEIGPHNCTCPEE